MVTARATGVEEGSGSGQGAVAGLAFGDGADLELRGFVDRGGPAAGGTVAVADVDVAVDAAHDGIATGVEVESLADDVQVGDDGDVGLLLAAAFGGGNRVDEGEAGLA
jgi:hypothetical protein